MGLDVSAMLVFGVPLEHGPELDEWRFSGDGGHETFAGHQLELSAMDPSGEAELVLFVSATAVNVLEGKWGPGKVVPVPRLSDDEVVGLMDVLVSFCEQRGLSADWERAGWLAIGEVF